MRDGKRYQLGLVPEVPQSVQGTRAGYDIEMPRVLLREQLHARLLRTMSRTLKARPVGIISFPLRHPLQPQQGLPGGFHNPGS